MGSEARPLAGLAVLVTRPAGRGGALERILERLGARVDVRPTIAIEPALDTAAAERAITGLAGFTWIAFTSAHGVRSFFAAAERVLARPLELGIPIAAVGPATAAAVRKCGAVARVVAEEAHADGLVAALAGCIGAADRVLVVSPEARRDALARGLGATGAAVEVRAFYRNVPAPGVADVARDIHGGRFDLAVFTSPSTVRRLVTAGAEAGLDVLPALRRMGLVAIGQVTARSLEELGLPVGAIAERPSDDAVATAVTRTAAGRVLASPARRGEAEETSRVTSPGSCRRTPLHEEHVRAGARMVEFAGWHMPIQYSGVVDEHLAVRTGAGLFDVSHMGELRVRGREAVAFLQYVTSNDVARLEPGRAQYTGLLTPEGGFVDDLLIYRLGPNELLLVVNAANTAKDVAWLREHARGFDVELSDESDAWAQIAFQGPRAAAILARSCALDLAAMRYYHFRSGDVAAVPCLVSRTGYTGEDGFELYAPADAGAHLWRTLLASGAGEGLVPVGLGARDTLRLEARMALYGNDIDETTTPFEADLGWIVRLAKGEFVGRAALVAQQERGIARKLVGFEMTGRAIARHGYPLLHSGGEVARVTSGSHAPSLKKSIGLAYLPLALAEPGTRIEIDVRGRAEQAQVVETPFYRRPASP